MTMNDGATIPGCRMSNEWQLSALSAHRPSGNRFIWHFRVFDAMPVARCRFHARLECFAHDHESCNTVVRSSIASNTMLGARSVAVNFRQLIN